MALDPKLSEYTRRVQENPKTTVFARLADIYRKAGDINKAIEVCEKGVQDNPSYATGYLILGRCHLERGATDKAQESFEKALSIDRRNFLALKMLGDIMISQGRKKEGVQKYAEILASDPMDSSIYELYHRYNGPALFGNPDQPETLAARLDALLDSAAGSAASTETAAAAPAEEKGAEPSAEAPVGDQLDQLTQEAADVLASPEGATSAKEAVSGKGSEGAEELLAESATQEEDVLEEVELDVETVEKPTENHIFSERHSKEEIDASQEIIELVEAQEAGEGEEKERIEAKPSIQEKTHAEKSEKGAAQAEEEKATGAQPEPEVQEKQNVQEAIPPAPAKEKTSQESLPEAGKAVPEPQVPEMKTEEPAAQAPAEPQEKTEHEEPEPPVSQEAQPPADVSVESAAAAPPAQETPPPPFGTEEPQTEELPSPAETPAESVAPVAPSGEAIQPEEGVPAEAEVQKPAADSSSDLVLEDSLSTDLDEGKEGEELAAGDFYNVAGGSAESETGETGALQGLDQVVMDETLSEQAEIMERVHEMEPQKEQGSQEEPTAPVQDAASSETGGETTAKRDEESADVSREKDALPVQTNEAGEKASGSLQKEAAPETGTPQEEWETFNQELDEIKHTVEEAKNLIDGTAESPPKEEKKTETKQEGSVAQEPGMEPQQTAEPVPIPAEAPTDAADQEPEKSGEPISAVQETGDLIQEESLRDIEDKQEEVEEAKSEFYNVAGESAEKGEVDAGALKDVDKVMMEESLDERPGEEIREPGTSQAPPSESETSLKTLPPNEDEQILEEVEIEEASERLYMEIPEGVASPTLAELFYRQGQRDQALEVYRYLVLRNPQNEKVLKRIQEIEAENAGEASSQVAGTSKTGKKRRSRKKPS